MHRPMLPPALLLLLLVAAGWSQAPIGDGPDWCRPLGVRAGSLPDSALHSAWVDETSRPPDVGVEPLHDIIPTSSGTFLPPAAPPQSPVVTVLSLRSGRSPPPTS